MTLARSAPVKPGRPAGDHVQVDVRRERLAPGVHPQDALAAVQVGLGHHDLPVEAAGPQQRRVEDVGTVGGGDQDHAALDVEAVHLDQQLVQGLLALVVAAAEAGPAVPADRVDLVDEDDGRGVGLGLLEQVADPGGADTDEHLDEVRAGDRVERHARLAGHGAGQQRLAGSGRPVQQHALGDLGPDGLELAGALQELLDLLELLDGLVGPGDVGERGLRRVLGDELGLGLAEVHDPGAAALHLVQEDEEEQEDQQERAASPAAATRTSWSWASRRCSRCWRQLARLRPAAAGRGQLRALVADPVGLQEPGSGDRSSW